MGKDVIIACDFACADAAFAFLDKFKDLRRVLLSAVDHNGIGTRPCKGKCTLKGVLHAALQNQAFDPRTDHEILGFLCLLARLDLGAEVFDRILRLFHLGAKQRVLFQTRFIFNDHHGNAHALQTFDRIQSPQGQFVHR